MTAPRKDIWHVLPINDLRDHIESPNCWCRPKRDEEDQRIIIHNSMDNRELYEEGQRKKS